ncbi:MAG: hypothetical protein HY248_06815, partial [Fimbriimonas ginsengisoli]|nr:hypothetical protein [Fimbriimonas ginsengisoli]
NSVIVNAPSKQQRDVEDLIKKIDRQTEQPQQSRVFKLLYAVADDLAPVVQNVLVSNAPTGRGGQGQQNVNFQQRFQQALRFGSAQASFGQVAADSRTNSLIVTATDENLKIVESVIKELDKDIPIQNTTFVFPLANARADQVAALITQALGSRSGTNSQANVARAPSTANRNTQNQNRNQNRPTNFMGGLGGEAAPPADQAVAQQQQQALELALQDPNADAGRLLTSVGVAQGGFFQQILGGQQRPGQTNQQNRGRDEQGRVVSVRDLVGQVTVIPDPNTNSVIVVGSPDSASLVRSILDQLDKIPEQVMIETIVVEATLDTANKLGIEWSLAQPRAFGTQGAVGNASQDFGLQSASPAPTGFKYTLNSGNLTAFLNAIRTDQRFEVLSTPRIFTSNNVQAEINISQSVPYVLSQRLDTNGNLTFNYAFQDVGIVLTVTPRITANGYVTMDVSQTANDLQGFTSFNAPIVNQRQADTTVSVKDGETVILGGIIRSTVSSTVRKIPLLGDIPILGNLFKTTEHDKQKTELMVFLSPHIVRNADEAKRLRERNQGELNPNNQRFVNENLDKDKPSLGPPEKNPQEKPPGDPKP